MKTDTEWLEAIKASVTATVGPKTILLESYVKSDLDISSVDLVEILFELENRTGFALPGGPIILGLTGGEATDFDVAQLIDQLKKFTS